MLALIALLVLVALPIYLFRRPKPPSATVDGGVRGALAYADAAPPFDGGSSADAATAKRIALEDPKVIRCVPRAGGRVSPEQCDRVRTMEDALMRAIRDNHACAPPSTVPFTVSYVLNVDFERRKVHLWAGRSGSLRKRQTGDLIRCVEHAIGQPDLVTVPHQFAKYEINVMASYPAMPQGAP